MLKGKIEELFERLESEGKLTVLPADTVAEFYQRISIEMSICRHELARKAAQSEGDLAKIVLNA